MAVPGGPFAFGDDPARLYPPDEDETPRRTAHVAAFRIGRVPVCGDDGVPLTYVSREEAEAFCAANGVRLPTELEGFHVSAGWGTYGFKAAPIVGKTLAELVATGRTPELIAPFALERFHTDTLVSELAAAAVSH